MAGPWRLKTQGGIDAVTIIGAFLANAEADSPSLMFFSWTVTEAVEALAWLLDCKPDDLRRLAPQDHPPRSPRG